MRRFPPPWTVQAIDAGFKVIDSNGQALAYVYGHADKRDAETAKGLTLDEASTHSEQHREAEGLTSRPRLPHGAQSGFRRCRRLVAHQSMTPPNLCTMERGVRLNYHYTRLR